MKTIKFCFVIHYLNIEISLSYFLCYPVIRDKSKQVFYLFFFSYVFLALSFVSDQSMNLNGNQTKPTKTYKNKTLDMSIRTNFIIFDVFFFFSS